MVKKASHKAFGDPIVEGIGSLTLLLILWLRRPTYPWPRQCHEGLSLEQ